MMTNTSDSPTQIQQLRDLAAKTGWQETDQGRSAGIKFSQSSTTVLVHASPNGRVVKVKRTSGAWNEPVEIQEPTTDKFKTAMRWLRYGQSGTHTRKSLQPWPPSTPRREAMAIDDALARLKSGLDRDEAIARAAIGKRGSEVGAVTQHWQWEFFIVEDDKVILTDGSAPINAAYCYADEVEKVAGLATLATAERYPARVADWQLPDRLLPGVEEPHAGAAQHIARHDPSRVADRYVPAIRRVIAEQEAAHSQRRVSHLHVRAYDDGYRAACDRIAALLASIYPDPTEESKL